MKNPSDQAALDRVVLAPILKRNVADHPDWDFSDHINAIVREGYTIVQAYSVAYGIHAAVARHEATSK